MSFLKNTYVKIALICVAIFLIVPLFLPSHFEFESQIQIDSTQEDAYDYLVNLESWKEWSPWLEKEPSAGFQFSGIPGVVGSYTEWEGKEIGSGRQTLLLLQEPNYLETKLEFLKPQSMEATGYLKLQPEGESVQVTWGIKGPLSYPMGRYFGLFIESGLAPDFKRGLQKLKNVLESSN